MGPNEAHRTARRGDARELSNGLFEVRAPMDGSRDDDDIRPAIWYACVIERGVGEGDARVGHSLREDVAHAFVRVAATHLGDCGRPGWMCK